ncbi:hypothetical protein L596_027865 [Steinernema carpocapsae]|nr:hypothetical protein L596_027865 [Steinernema carpocapsae]
MRLSSRTHAEKRPKTQVACVSNDITMSLIGKGRRTVALQLSDDLQRFATAAAQGNRCGSPTAFEMLHFP